jgi:hypothetical protein
MGAFGTFGFFLYLAILLYFISPIFPLFEKPVSFFPLVSYRTDADYVHSLWGTDQ